MIPVLNDKTAVTDQSATDTLNENNQPNNCCGTGKPDLFPNLENYEPMYEEIYGYCEITD